MQIKIVIFAQQNFLISSIILDGYLFELIITPLTGKFLRRYAWTDPQNKHFPLILSNPQNIGISWCKLLLTPLICTPLSETVYCICSCHQKSCFHIGITIWWSTALYPLDTHLLKFGYVNICIHETGSKWPCYHDMANPPLLWIHST